MTEAPNTIRVIVKTKSHAMRAIRNLRRHSIAAQYDKDDKSIVTFTLKGGAEHTRNVILKALANTSTDADEAAELSKTLEAADSGRRYIDGHYWPNSILKNLVVAEDIQEGEYLCEPRRAVYIGEDIVLHGAGATVQESAHGDHLYAQFNSPRTAKCFGWWRFQKEEFT